MSFETKLEKYARLIVQSGLNVQEKQTVVISASIESYQLVRAVTKQAYLVGAKEVVVHYSDEEVTRMKYENMEVEDFNHVPTWFSSFRNDYALMLVFFMLMMKILKCLQALNLKRFLIGKEQLKRHVRHILIYPII